jgi:hypothetical protein
MKATYHKILSCLKKRDTVTLSSEPRHVLVVGLSDRLYAFTSPRGTWTSRTPIVLRKDTK